MEGRAPSRPTNQWDDTEVVPLISRLSSGIILRHRVPIHHVPPRLDVIGAAVLVLEIIGMFPNIESMNGRVTLHERAVLVRRGDHFELAALVFDQPNPAAAKATRTPGREFFLEIGRASCRER